MVFAEKKVGDSYAYEVEDLFGKIEFTAPIQLSKEILDAVVLLVLRNKAAEGNIEKVGPYKFKPAANWLPDEEK